MHRASACLVLLLVAPAAAQDMNLTQVLLEGEGWKASANTSFNVPRPPYAAAPEEGTIYRVGDDGKKVKVAEGVGRPTALALSPDGGTLVVADAAGKHLFAFRVEKDGGLTCKEAYGTMLLAPGQKASGAAGMTVDAAGRFYVATPLGIQVFDPTCRLVGVISLPAREPPGVISFGGPDGSQLYCAIGGQLYVRKTKTQGPR